MISTGRTDARGRAVSLRPLGEDWQAVADVAPADDQRDFVYALAARYILMSERGGPWTSLGVYADGDVVGHVMWGLDDDASHWIGGLIVDHSQQGRGLGRAITLTLVDWFRDQAGHWTTRLTYRPENTAAVRLYASLGFVPTGEMDDDEVVAELRPAGPDQRTT